MILPRTSNKPWRCFWKSSKSFNNFREDSKTRNNILVEEPDAYYQESYKFNYQRFFTGNPQEKLSIILQAEEHILGLQEGKERFIREVSLLSQALSLCISREEVQPHLAEVAFFQAVKARLAKFDVPLGGGNRIRRSKRRSSNWWTKR